MTGQVGDEWVAVGLAADIPRRGARVVETPYGDIALFHTATGSVFALEDRCPHRGGPLSQGIVHGEAVTCPLHNWVISLTTGEVEGPDVGCTRTIPVRVEEGLVLISLAGLALRRKVA